jgi:pimeloyl-ACP methyl ester carboxylesterase
MQWPTLVQYIKFGLACMMLALLLTASSINATASQTSTAASWRIQQAEIGGLALEYVDSASLANTPTAATQGGYTLVVESGVGTGLRYWQPLLADFAALPMRTIIYSRAGNGQSEQTADPSLPATALRLTQLLQQLKVQPPLILVGHSFGALHARFYAATHPAAVAGLILIDPSHEQFGQSLARLDPQWAAKDAATLDKLLAAAPEWQVLQQLYQQQSLAADIKPQLPLVLLTSVQQQESDWWIGHSAKGKQLWLQLHQQLLARQHNAVHLVTDRSGHHIPLEQPKLVFSALQSLLLLLQLQPLQQQTP